jgi:hypothetical protein
MIRRQISSSNRQSISNPQTAKLELLWSLDVGVLGAFSGAWMLVLGAFS